MSEFDTHEECGELLFSTVEALLDLPELKCAERVYDYSVPARQYALVNSLRRMEAWKRIIPAPGEKIIEVFVNGGTPILDGLRARGNPNYMDIQFLPSVERPWVFVTFGYLFDSEILGISSLVTLTFGLEGADVVKNGKVYVERSVCLHDSYTHGLGVLPDARVLIPSICEEAKAVAVASFLAVAKELVGSSNNAAKL